MYKHLKILALSVALGSLSGCANLFNSSVGPEGQPIIITDGKATAIEAKTQTKTVTTHKSQQALEIYNPQGNQIKETVIAEASALPTYASTSKVKCNFDNDKASALAQALASKMAQTLANESGKIYVSPTVISDEYSDCAHDLSNTIASALSSSGNFETVSTNIAVAQNQGSSLMIPSLIRQCKAHNIPYVAISVIQKHNGKAKFSLRIIRVQDGVTLSQNSNNI